ncbi:autotransporter domain-containing protein [Pasteurella canis]|uniref:autotransporter domain-containing protein n=1 Tax=Pasteurella canis TaxID=753 RepID=UPI001CC455C6|nr:autotransporter domain-containing protein [Pasteurella canis]UAY76870.1 autotransporter domain-containing protein [Pasteurella canis]
MQQKYQKLIIPTLSLFFASCGGGGGSENAVPPINQPNTSRNNHTLLPEIIQLDNDESSTISNSDSENSTNINVEPLPNLEASSNLDEDKVSNSSIVIKSNSNSISDLHTNILSKTNTNLPIHTPYNVQNNQHTPITDKEKPHTKNLTPTLEVTETFENKLQTSRLTTNNKHDSLNNPTHDINASEVFSLLPKHTQYIDDENTIKDVAIIDTAYYLSDSFKDKNGQLRLQLHNQHSALIPTISSHGTMVAAVINRYNSTATMYAYNTHHNTSQIFLVRNTDYDIAHSKGVRIFNNSYGSDAIDSEYAISLGNNIEKYAKEDSIFIWSAGNENKNHASPDSLHPTINDDTRNGWISVAETDYSNGIYRTTERKTYDYDHLNQLKASNYIGESAKTWGIATQGTYWLPLKDKDGKTNYTFASGTSFSAPRVTAAAANVWTKFPWMDNHLVVVSLLSTADKPGTFLKGQDGVCSSPAIGCGETTTDPEYKFGWGLLNERRALKGPALFDKRLLTNKDAITTNNENGFTKNENVSGKNSSKNLLVVNFDFRHYQDKEKLTWSNDIKGDAGILKQGSGTLYLNGQNQYQGKTIVDSGILGIGHSLTSEVIINREGTLLAEFDTQKHHNSAQKVTLGNNKNNPNYTVKNNGSLYVYGAGLTINGNYNGNANSRIVIDIDKSKLEVTGTMDLGGSSKIVADVKDISSLTPNSNGIPSQNETEKTIISANLISNHQNVTYAKTNRINNYIDISQFYINENKEIKVKYKRNSTAYVLETINYTAKSAIQTASNIDKALNTLASSNEYHVSSPKAAKLLSADKADLPTIINSLSGEIYASSQNAMLKQNLVVNQQLTQRIMSLNNGTKNGLWVDGIYAHSNIAQHGYASATAKTTGTQLGFDNKISNNLSLGFAVNQSNTNTDFNREAGKSKTKNTGIFTYGTYQFNHLYLATIAGFSYAKNNIDRIVFDEQSQTKFMSKTYNLYTELGTNLSFAKSKINPFIANTVNYINRGGFKENIAFGIDAKSKTYRINSFILGIRSHITFDKLTLNTSFSHTYTPENHDFGFTAKFTGFTDTIHIHGIKQNKHTSWFRLGTSYELQNGLSLQIGYNLSIQERKKENEILNLGITYKF